MNQSKIVLNDNLNVSTKYFRIEFLMIDHLVRYLRKKINQYDDREDLINVDIYINEMLWNY
jgi:hypothetical protein